MEEEILSLNYPPECTESFVKVMSRKSKKKFSKQSSGKAKQICGEKLEQFQTPNPFNLLEDIDDECVQGIKLKIKIKMTPKKEFKKCRYCNHKKRACSVRLEDILQRYCTS